MNIGACIWFVLWRLLTGQQLSNSRDWIYYHRLINLRNQINKWGWINAGYKSGMPRWIITSAHIKGKMCNIAKMLTFNAISKSSSCKSLIYMVTFYPFLIANNHVFLNSVDVKFVWISLCKVILKSPTRLRTARLHCSGVQNQLMMSWEQGAESSVYTVLHYGTTQWSTIIIAGNRKFADFP